MLIIDIEKQLGSLGLKVNTQLPMEGISVIFGRSGAGKTSLIQILSGLVTPDNGRLILNGEVLFDPNTNLSPEQRQLGYVFQDARLFPHYKVRGNLNYGIRDKRGIRGNSKKVIKNHQPGKDPLSFASVVELLGLEDLLERYPASLSGGEKQRVAIGRALLTRPKMLLMDEPLSSLDQPRKQELIPYLQQLAHKVKIPILYVSHSLDEIQQLADHMLILDKGKMVAHGAITEVRNSTHMTPWLSAMEHSSLLVAKVAEIHPKYDMTRVILDDNTSLWLNERLTEQGKIVRVCIKSNHVSVCIVPPEGSSIRNIVKAKINQIIPQQDNRNRNHVRLKLSLPNNYLWATITPWALDDLALTVGQQIYVQIKGINLY